TVRSREGAIHHQLECVAGARAFLKVMQRGRHIMTGSFAANGHQEPRPPVTQHQKINLALQLVAYIAQLEPTESQVGPALYRLQQMTCNERSAARRSVSHARPVPQEPAWFLSKGLGHARIPGPDAKSILQTGEQSQPARDCVDCNADFTAQRGVADSSRGA